MQDHCRYRDVERSGQFIREQEARPAGDSPRDSGAGVLTAGELKREQLQWKLNALCTFFDPQPQRSAGAHAGNPQKRVRNTIECGETRVQAFIGTQKHDLDSFLKA